MDVPAPPKVCNASVLDDDLPPESSTHFGFERWKAEGGSIAVEPDALTESNGGAAMDPQGSRIDGVMGCNLLESGLEDGHIKILQ
ncbi:MAG: hypothetical protein Q9226_003141 [Calogaya cf. arnoldii]